MVCAQSADCHGLRRWQQMEKADTFPRQVLAFWFRSNGKPFVIKKISRKLWMVVRAKRFIVFWTFSLFHFIHYLLFSYWNLKMENYSNATACKPANVTKKKQKKWKSFFLFACVRFWAANWNRHGNRAKSLKRKVILFYFRFHCHRFWFTLCFFFFFRRNFLFVTWKAL